jgi:hypothetical protein
LTDGSLQRIRCDLGVKSRFALLIGKIRLRRWLGPKATVRDMRRKLRCSRCDTREPNVTALWIGKRGDGR